jgi:hypothetical protein
VKHRALFDPPLPSLGTNLSRAQYISKYNTLKIECAGSTAKPAVLLVMVALFALFGKTMW